MNKTAPIITALFLSLLLAGCESSQIITPSPLPSPSPTPTPQSILSETEAKTIAQNTCIKGGEALGEGMYNDYTKTWWFDANLNTTKPGCNPACVVSEETKTAEINWRCTGLLQK